MLRCFVIQPFDSGKFDKRFEDVYKPAINDAGLEAYRVDRDPAADVPIDSIEREIRNSAICFADITEDNPNVWYELGFAFASEKSVVMVCSSERVGKKFPFDIQHRAVISYNPESPSDFQSLKTAITTRLKALLEKGATLRYIASKEHLAEVEGLTQSELIVLAAAAGSALLPDAGAPLYSIQREAEQVGLTNMGFALGLRRLLAKRFVELSVENDIDGEYNAIRLTDTGWTWLERNEERFVTVRKVPARTDLDLNDIPF